MPKDNGSNRSDDERLRRSLDRMFSTPDQFKDEAHNSSEIPQFDLAEQIMAEQRKIASTKRKGPGRKVVEPAKQERPGPIAPVVDMFHEPTEEEKVIAEIVARDIRQLCGLSI